MKQGKVTCTQRLVESEPIVTVGGTGIVRHYNAAELKGFGSLHHLKGLSVKTYLREKKRKNG